MENVFKITVCRIHFFVCDGLLERCKNTPNCGVIWCAGEMITILETFKFIWELRRFAINSLYYTKRFGRKAIITALNLCKGPAKWAVAFDISPELARCMSGTKCLVGKSLTRMLRRRRVFSQRLIL